MKKNYLTPNMKVIKISNCYLLAGSNETPTEGEGSGYEWGDE